ncbi:MAG: thiamine phosphate synthase [Gammaproteobacteria bacterium]
MRYPNIPCGLYAVTDPRTGAVEDLIARVEQAIKGGARMIQYRDKLATAAQRRERAAALVDFCGRYRVPLIINDDVELTCAIGANGVHLGRHDMSIAAARAALGKGAIIGASCYNDLLRAEQACQAGADYVAFGSFFPSPSKPDAVTANLALLGRARAALAIPVCAIGGVTAANAAPLIRAGADLVAVISGVFGRADPESAAREIAALFHQ